MKKSEKILGKNSDTKLKTLTDAYRSVAEIAGMDAPKKQKKYKYAQCGQEIGAAALFFAIHGQIVCDASGKVVYGTYRFPLGAEEAFGALYGEKLTPSNSELMEAAISDTGKEIFRTVNEQDEKQETDMYIPDLAGYRTGKQVAIAF